jgi:hypothetical protein
LTGLDTIHTLPGKHFFQEDQAPAIADHVAALARKSGALPRRQKS